MLVIPLLISPACVLYYYFLLVYVRWPKSAISTSLRMTPSAPPCKPWEITVWAMEWRSFACPTLGVGWTDSSGRRWWKLSKKSLLDWIFPSLSTIFEGACVQLQFQVWAKLAVHVQHITGVWKVFILAQPFNHHIFSHLAYCLGWPMESRILIDAHYSSIFATVI